MLIRIEKTLIMLLLLFAYPILRAADQDFDQHRLPGENTTSSLQSNDEVKQRAALLAAHAHALAQSLLAQPSINEQKKMSAQAERLAPEKIWCAQSGKTLKNSLIAWSKTSGWSMKWQADYDYPILAEVCFKGSFEQAMEGVIHAYQEAEYPLYLDIYPQQQLTVISH